LGRNVAFRFSAWAAGFSAADWQAGFDRNCLVGPLESPFPFREFQKPSKRMKSGRLFGERSLVAAR
jgi:hypothetical protein